MSLPSAQELFERNLLPWFDGETQPSGLRLETYVTQGLAGKMMEVKQHLRADYVGVLDDYLRETLPHTAKGAYQSIIPFHDFNEDVLRDIYAYYDTTKIMELIANSQPADFNNEYLTTVSQFAGAISTLFVKRQGFAWLYSHPYFHSVIVHEGTGITIPVFDWVLRAFSQDGVNEDIVGKFHAVIANT